MIPQKRVVTGDFVSEIYFNSILFIVSGTPCTTCSLAQNFGCLNSHYLLTSKCPFSTLICKISVALVVPLCSGFRTVGGDAKNDVRR